MTTNRVLSLTHTLSEGVVVLVLVVLVDARKVVAMGPRIQIKHNGRQTAEEKKLEAKYDLLRKKKELKLAKKMVKDAEKKAKTEKTKKKDHRDDDEKADE